MLLQSFVYLENGRFIKRVNGLNWSVRNKIRKLREVTVVRIKTSPQNRILHRSSSANTRHPNILFVLANYLQFIVLFAESELWFSSYADWLRSVFYCYILIFGKTNTMAIVITRHAQKTKTTSSKMYHGDPTSGPLGIPSKHFKKASCYL